MKDTPLRLRSPSCTFLHMSYQATTPYPKINLEPTIIKYSSAPYHSSSLPLYTLSHSHTSPQSPHDPIRHLHPGQKRCLSPPPTTPVTRINRIARRRTSGSLPRRSGFLGILLSGFTLGFAVLGLLFYTKSHRPVWKPAVSKIHGFCFGLQDLTLDSSK